LLCTAEQDGRRALSKKNEPSALRSPEQPRTFLGDAHDASGPSGGGSSPVERLGIGLPESAESFAPSGEWQKDQALMSSCPLTEPAQEPDPQHAQPLIE
jgi:hypothetical protein